MAENTKPPLGLLPQWVSEFGYIQARNKEILLAMSRYNEANKPIPEEWISELSELSKRLYNLIAKPQTNHRNP